MEESSNLSHVNETKRSLKKTAESAQYNLCGFVLQGITNYFMDYLNVLYTHMHAQGVPQRFSGVGSDCKNRN